MVAAGAGTFSSLRLATLLTGRISLFRRVHTQPCFPPLFRHDTSIVISTAESVLVGERANGPLLFLFARGVSLHFGTDPQQGGSRQRRHQPWSNAFT